MQRILSVFAVAIGLVGLWSLEAHAAACDESRLDALAKTLPFVDHDTSQAVVARVLLEACPDLPGPLRTVLFGRLTVTHEKFAEFAHSQFVSDDARALLKAACPDGFEALVPGRFTRSEKRYREIFKACAFDRLDFATDDEMGSAHPDEVSERAFTVLAPVVFQWMLAQHIDQGLAKGITRALAELPSGLAPPVDRFCDEDRLMNTAGVLDSVAPELLVRIAAQGLLESCPVSVLPRPMWDLLELLFLADQPHLERALEGALGAGEGEKLLQAACGNGAAEVLPPGGKDTAANRAELFRKCGFDKLGFATADEIATTFPASGRTLVFLVPILYQRLLRVRTDATIFRYLTRRMIGLKDVPPRH